MKQLKKILKLCKINNISLNRNILKCTSLKEKVIYDTDCLTDFFSFQSLKKGAKRVIGIDHDEPAIKICNKLCDYNNHYIWKMGEKKKLSDVEFRLNKIGKEDIFTDKDIDIVFVLNYLHHLKNELEEEILKNTIDSFFKNSKVVFEVNESEIVYIENSAKENNFKQTHKIESHRKTMFGNRWVLHYSQ